MLRSPALGKYPKIVCLLTPNPGLSFLPPKKPLWGREEAGQEFDLQENTWGPKAQAPPCHQAALGAVSTGLKAERTWAPPQPLGPRMPPHACEDSAAGNTKAWIQEGLLALTPRPLRWATAFPLVSELSPDPH